MYGKILIAMMIITISCDISQGSLLHCGNGESYWCLSAANARECGKEAYCDTILKATAQVTKEANAVIIQPVVPPETKKNYWPYINPSPGRYSGLYPGGFGK
ncbi:uncharacterized protein LOC107039586 [Diachasma alloeum]|uniref:uncharacterized protein LOC107039586 n=1 Tax=Diachasma alloeum TaxID=454923 RepID=UPI00073823AF|nr:uncharacterized protein LOC107039586 [Diachasma alloeum]